MLYTTHKKYVRQIKAIHNVFVVQLQFLSLSLSDVLILEKSCPRVWISWTFCGLLKLWFSLSFRVTLFFSLLFKGLTHRLLYWSWSMSFVWFSKMWLLEMQWLLLEVEADTEIDCGDWKLSDAAGRKLSEVEGCRFSELILGRLIAESVMTVSIISNVNICNLIISFRRFSFSAWKFAPWRFWWLFLQSGY